jgi:hypothetical protein
MEKRLGDQEEKRLVVLRDVSVDISISLATPDLTCRAVDEVRPRFASARHVRTLEKLRSRDTRGDL